ncbi:uncharacterized protein METZ01_LOCUS257522 [marine metagenome]|uniref:Uncharacterized protein n=1 Tax=marine metagenome TaxID=408172 RepID=A0A382IYP7_9ZZZZ
MRTSRRRRSSGDVDLPKAQHTSQHVAEIMRGSSPHIIGA